MAGSPELPSWDETVDAAIASPELPSWDETIDAAPAVETAPVDAAPLPTWDDTVPAEAFTQTTTPEQAEQSKNWFLSRVIKKDQLNEIARRHGVTPEWLETRVGWFGGSAPVTGDIAEDVAETGKSAVGAVGRSFAFNLPFWLYKKTQDDNERAALDDMAALINQNASWTQEIAAGLLPMGAAKRGAAAVGLRTATQAAGTGVVGQVAKASAGGALVGATAGLGFSREGEELESAATGAKWGALLTGGLSSLAGAAKLGTRAYSQRIANQYAESMPAGLLDRIDDSFRARADKESLISNAVLNEGMLEAATNQKLWYTIPPAEKQAFAASLDKKFRIGIERGLRLPKAQGGVGKQAFAIMKRSPEELDDIVAHTAYTKMVKDFANFTTGAKFDTIEEATEAVQQLLRTDKQVSAAFTEFRKAQHATSVLNKEIVKHTTKAGEEGFWQGQRSRFVDSRYVYTAIDRKLGTNYVTIVDDLSLRQNQFQKHAALLFKKEQDLHAITRRSSLTPQNIYRIIDQKVAKMESDIAALAPNDRKAVLAWQEHFEFLRKEAGEVVDIATGKNIGLNIERLEGRGYVPHAVKPLRELVPAFVRRRKKVEGIHGVKFADLSEQQLKGMLISKDFATREYLIALNGGVSDSITNVKQLQRAITMSESVEGATHQLLTRAASALERKGYVPKFIREEDISKLTTRWTQNTFRHIYLREGVQKLRAASDILRAGTRRHSVESRYIYEHAQDIMGMGRPSLQRDTHNKVVSYILEREKRAEELAAAGKPLKASIAKAQAQLPDIMSKAVQQMYPFYLGLRADAVLRNLTQPFALTSNELAAGYGEGLALTHTFSAPVAYRQGVLKEMANQGLLPPKTVLEYVKTQRDGMARGMQRVSLGADKFLDEANSVALLGYTTADVHNRVVTYLMGKTWANDMVQAVKVGKGARQTLKQKLAMRSLLRIDEGYQRDITRALQSGDSAKVQALATKYLISKTQFHYNKIALSEFGRSFGPVMSMFMKWPSSILGDVTDQMNKVGAVNALSPKNMRTVRRYYGPLISAIIAEQLILPDKRDSAARKMFMKNAVTWTPASSLAPFMSGSFAPAALSPVQDIASMAINWDKFRAETAAAAIMPTIPMATWVDFIWKDLPEWDELD